MGATQTLPRAQRYGSSAEWGLSQAGQNYGAQLGYLPLSDDVTELGNQALQGLTE